MTRAGYQGPDFRDPAERPTAVAGLSMRLAEKAIAKADETPRLFLPVFRPVQVADRPKGSDR